MRFSCFRPKGRRTGKHQRRVVGLCNVISNIKGRLRLFPIMRYVTYQCRTRAKSSQQIQPLKLILFYEILGRRIYGLHFSGTVGRIILSLNKTSVKELPINPAQNRGRAETSNSNKIFNLIFLTVVYSCRHAFVWGGGKGGGLVLRDLGDILQVAEPNVIENVLFCDSLRSLSFCNSLAMWTVQLFSLARKLCEFINVLFLW